MAHKLPRLSKSILEKPQFIHPTKFKEVAEVLENRNEFFQNYTKDAFFGFEDDDEVQVDDEYGDPTLGVLRVEGPTTYKPTGWEAYCGGCSYVGLIEQMKEFAEQGKKKVLMKVNSPGGMAYRMAFTSRELRRIADENDIELVAYVDGMAASAGMGLASAAHTIVANPESELGSVGVVVSLLDSSKAMDEAGYKRIFITAGSEKVPFDDSGSFKESFLKDIQESVDKLYEKFTAHVAEMRNIDVQVVKDTEARMFDAEDALEIGLADRVMEEPEFLEFLLGKPASDDTDSTEDRSDQDGQPESKEYLAEDDGSARLNNNTEETTLMSDPNTPQLSAEEIAEFASMKAELAAFKAKEVEDKKAALEASLDNSGFLANCKANLVSFFMSGDVAEENKELMNSVIEAANTELNTKAEAAAAKLAEVEAEKLTEVEAANKLAETAKAEAEEAKKEFATTNFAERSETKELNVQLSHEERLAQAVAAEKAKRNAK